jgi:ankyrin repeat protein
MIENVAFLLSIDAKDEDGRTALSCAATGGHAEFVKVLLAAGYGY